MNKITEQRNPLSDDLDIKSITEIISLINDEDHLIPKILKKHLKDIKLLICNVVDSFDNNGRLFYIGCGTSGRLGVLDASECPPTFKTNSSLVQGIIAGGNRALYESIEGAEDSFKDGFESIINKKITKNDTVVGISASGTAQFVLGGLNSAKKVGAHTALITFNKVDSHSFIDKTISVIVGPEIISGSTRMKAGTATKMILNMISTTSLIKSNKIYKNYMVDLKVSNKKLKNRAIQIIEDICKISYDKAELLLIKADNDVKTALAMYYLKVNKDTANKKLNEINGNLRQLIK